MIVFALESSCDETAAAVVKDQKEVLSSVVSSQIDTHTQFGGVVPGQCMIVFALESSCDETAAAVVKDQKEVLSSVVSSQIDTHTQFGGVVPEVASRLHVENISTVISKAIEESGLGWEDIDLISVTQGPGLIGCLHVGVQAAKTLAMLFDKPLVGVNHLAGHIYANKLDTDLKFPLLALLVSGGNSELI